MIETLAKPRRTVPSLSPRRHCGTQSLVGAEQGVVGTGTPSRTVRVAELDALRACAALAVVGYHLRPYYVPFGWASVDLFFVLSGFLITKIIVKSLHEPGFLRTFYFRRATRIFPIYYLAISIVIAANFWLPRPYDLGDSLPWYATYSQNLWAYWGGTSHHLPPLGHTWTLAIEEQFYMFWPIALMLAGARAVIPLSVFVVFLATIARTNNFHEHLLITRWDGFAFGAIAAAILEGPLDGGMLRRRTHGFGAIFAVGSLVLLTGSAVVGVLAFWRDESSFLMEHAQWMMPILNATFMSVVAIVVLAQGHRLLTPLRWRWLCYLGQISYGLYLYHWIVLTIARQFPGFQQLLGPNIADLTLVATSIALAMLSWHLIERPIAKQTNKLTNCWAVVGNA